MGARIAAANLSKGMRRLNGVYTQAFNRRHRTVGNLFQGRYKGILVERDAYLLEVSRYVVLNPVRAGLVAEAGDWPWGSCGSMVGTTSIPDWLETDWMLSRYRHRPRAPLAYIGFVRGGIGLHSIWEALRNQIYLGSDEFPEKVSRGK